MEQAAVAAAPRRGAPPAGEAGTSRTIWVNKADPARAPDHVQFRSYWRLDAGETEAIAVLSDYEGIHTWWGRTFLRTDVLSRPPGGGLLGLTGQVTSRGCLPYIFTWRAEVVAATPDRVTLSAEGDFNGTGTFRRPRPDEAAEMVFDWDVRIGKPLLRLFTPWACGLYRWNHAFAMSDGARSLQAEILRRRGR